MKNKIHKNKIFLTLTMGLILAAGILAGCKPAYQENQPKFVAIAGDGKAAYSFDGIKWKGATLPGNADWISVCYGNGTFVTVARFDNTVTITDTNYMNSGKAVYSNDGINWEESALPEAPWYSVCYGKEKFVAVAYMAAKAAYSNDGINWKLSTLPYYMTEICYGKGKFVAMTGGDESSGSAIAAYSNDGIKWIETSMPDDSYWVSICYGNGKFVAVANSDGLYETISTPTDIAAYSDNGINWKKTTIPSNANWSSVCYGNGKFVAIGSGGKATYSFDGIKWKAVTMPGNAGWSHICYGNDRFVAVAASIDDYDDNGSYRGTVPSNTAAYSEDGINWKLAKLPYEANWRSLCYGEK